MREALKIKFIYQGNSNIKATTQSGSVVNTVEQYAAVTRCYWVKKNQEKVIPQCEKSRIYPCVKNDSKDLMQ